MLFGLFNKKNISTKTNTHSQKRVLVNPKAQNISDLVGISTQSLTKIAFVIHLQEALDQFRQEVEALYLKGGSISRYPAYINQDKYVYAPEDDPQKVHFATSPKTFLQEGHTLMEKFAIRFASLVANMGFKQDRYGGAYRSEQDHYSSFYGNSKILCLFDDDKILFSVGIDNSTADKKEDFGFFFQLSHPHKQNNRHNKRKQPHFQASFGQTKQSLSRTMPYFIDCYLESRTPQETSLGDRTSITKWENGFTTHAPKSIEEEAIRLSTVIADFLCIALPAFISPDYKPSLKQALLNTALQGHLPSYPIQQKTNFTSDLDRIIGNYLKGILQCAKKAKEQDLAHDETMDALRNYHFNFSEYQVKPFYLQHTGVLKIDVQAKNATNYYHYQPIYIGNYKIMPKSILSIWMSGDVLFSISANGLQIYLAQKKEILAKYFIHGADTLPFLRLEDPHWEQQKEHFTLFAKKSFYLTIGYNSPPDNIKDLLIPRPYKLGIFADETAFKNYLSELYDVFIQGLLFRHSCTFISENFPNNAEKKQAQAKNKLYLETLVRDFFSSGLKMKKEFYIQPEYNFERVVVQVSIGIAHVTKTQYAFPKKGSFVSFKSHSSKFELNKDFLLPENNKDFYQFFTSEQLKPFVELAGYDYLEKITPNLFHELYGSDDDLFYPRIE